MAGDTHVIPVRWYPRDERVRTSLAYIVHREEGLPDGRARTLCGIGQRYRQARGDEHAIAGLLWADGRAIGAPRYYRVKLTVNDTIARELARLPFHPRERAFRAAIRACLKQALPLAQGAFVLHSHSRGGRAFGHPHAHVHLSPARLGGGPFLIRKAQLAALKAAWASALRRSIERARAPKFAVGMARPTASLDRSLGFGRAR